MHIPEPIATMMREHRTLLALLNDLSDGVAAQSGPDCGKLAELLDKFVQNLEAHIYKEEQLLFPSVRLALGQDADALGIIEAEHTRVDSLCSQFSDLAKCLLGSAACDAQTLNRLAELISTAREALPAHIFKEDNVVYPLASKIISREKLSELALDAKTEDRTE